MAQQPVGDPWPKDDKLELGGSETSSFHAYLHIPFCATRCGYCDFNTYTKDEIPGIEKASFHEALIREIYWSSKVIQNSSAASRPVSTVFFGGGTPSQLAPAQIKSMLDALRDTFGLSPDAEVTLEANPDDLDDQDVLSFSQAGINRLSLGAQSFDSAVLQILERRHNPDRIEPILTKAKSLRMRTSIDLIFGTPGESVNSWLSTLEEATQLSVEHISAYSLIVEPGTKLSRQIRKGDFAAPDDDELAEKYELAAEALGRAGFTCYEVSNFTRGEPSQHNVAYWQSQDWWGFGPGAHSHFAGTRWWNHKHPSRYVQGLQQGAPVAGIERLSAEQRRIERLMLGLRLSAGMQESDLLLAGVTDSQIEAAVLEGHLERHDGNVRVSAASRFLADGIILRLLSASAE